MKEALKIVAVSVGVGGAIFAALCVLMSFIPWKEKRLYQQCLGDGIKEYECYSLIYGRGRR